MSAISMILVVIVAFLAGMEGVLDEFQFHQPLIACTLIGLVTGHLVPCVMLGGSLQMLALGWANIGAAVAPDAALAAVASTIIFIQSGGEIKQIGTAIAVAIPLAVAGLFLTMIVRTISVAIIHIMDKEAAKANFRGVDLWQMLAVSLQGLRIAIPAAAMLFVPASAVRAFLGSMPVWPFFMIGFALAAVSELTLIAIGAIGLALTLMYLSLESKGGSGSNGGSGSDTGDPLGDILDDY